MLGRYLEKKNYTSHAPIYRGHGLPPEALLKTNPDEWWEDVLEAYQHLRDLGYQEIAVAGLSMGGVLSLKMRSEEHTSELQSRGHLVCRLLLEKKNRRRDISRQ